MNRSTTGRQAAAALLQSISRPAASSSRCGLVQHMQSFSTSPVSLDGPPVKTATERRQSLIKDVTGRRRVAPPARSENMVAQVQSAMLRANNDPTQLAIDKAASRSNFLDIMTAEDQRMQEEEGQNTKVDEEEPYHFHVYSHKHNTHVTVTKPNRDAIMSYSCGNLGFKHSQRKSYDAAYQLGAYVVDKLLQNNWHNKIHKLEVCLRGFGPGREAVTKVLLGNEGKLLVNRIVKVSDLTRLKFGGTRSKNKRRL